jgi:4-amino-4-deoxy-L-arabinose transferase-like glycosyltransferase
VTAAAIPTNIPRNRLILILVALALLLLVVVLYSRDSWLLVLIGTFSDGAIAILWLISAALLGDIVASRLSAPTLLRWCTAAALGLGFFSLAMLALGLAGMLSFGACVALLVFSAAAGIADIVLTKRRFVSPKTDDSHPIWDWLWLLLIPLAAIALTGTNVFPAVLWWPNDPHPYDVLGYHLQVPREWYEMGRVAPLHHNMYSFFPFAAEMNFLLAMVLRGGPWAGMYLAQMMSFIYMALAVIGVAAAMPNRRAGVIAGLAMGATPWTTQLGAMAYNESALLLYVALAAAWIVRALSDRTHLVRDMLIAGVMSGLACGVKYTAVPVILIGFAVSAVGAGIIVCRNEWKRLLMGAFISVAAGLLIFSPWLVRNAVWAGNPVFPLEMRRLGRAHFTEEQVERFERAHRAAPDAASLPARLSRFWREIFIGWQFGWLLIPLAIFGAILNIRRPEVLFLILSIILIALFWIFLTHLMGRFFVPAMPLLAILAGYTALKARTTLIGVAAVSIMAVVSLINLHQSFTYSLEKRYAYDGLFRLSDPSPLWPPQLADIEKSDAKLALIGDAQAFYRSLPMTRLKYRTIFDVVVPPGKNIVDAWLGRDLDELRRDHYIILNPGELDRLQRTYYGIPPVPPQWQQRRDETIILAPTR